MSLNNWNRRNQDYEKVIKDNNLTGLAKIVRELEDLAKIKDLSFGERKVLETARRNIFFKLRGDYG